MASLATAVDMIVRYDETILRDLLSDTGTPAQEPELTNNSRLNSLLESASGYVLACAMSGNNYQEAELLAMTGNGLALLVDMVCQVTMCKLMRRRPGRFKIEEIQGQEKTVEEWLDMLRKGQRLFPIDAHATASTPTIDGPTSVTLDRMNLITSRTKNFYPNVASRLPIGRG